MGNLTLGARRMAAHPQGPPVGLLFRHLAESPSGTVVFYAGWFNGNFVFHMRQHDPEGRVVVLSGTKMLVVTLAEKEHGMKVLVTTPEGILEVFRKYGVRYVALFTQLAPNAAT